MNDTYKNAPETIDNYLTARNTLWEINGPTRIEITAAKSAYATAHALIAIAGELRGIRAMMETDRGSE